MDRKDFIKKTVAASVVGALAPSMIRASNVKLKTSDYDKLINQVGFNHLPNKEDMTANTVLHKANTRGHANHGWLDSHHTFSFANYHNPERMHFGVLRVLNDDQVAAAKGFGTHPHDNMEIISIPLEGDLEHKDSLGNVAVIKEGDVQVMSAGTGVFHSEYNKNSDKQVRFLQIWVFPNKKQLEPRYDQVSMRELERDNAFFQIVSPNRDDQGAAMNQNAWFNMGKFSQATTTDYELHDAANGVYAFVLEGEATINGQKLERRDGFGIWDVTKIKVEADPNSKILLMEVPMNI